MIKIIPLLAICAIGFGCTSTTPKKCATLPTPVAPAGLLQGDYKLNPTFSDEFEDGFDYSRWNKFYTNWDGRIGMFHFAQKNVDVRDGQLVLTARAEDVSKVDPKLVAEGKGRYSTAIFRSKTRVHYGYFEVKFKSMNACVCNAFWLNDPIDPPKKYRPGDKIEEIDIFEVFGKCNKKPKRPNDPPIDRTYFTTTHVADTPYVESKVWLGREVEGKKLRVNESFSERYHTGGLLWTPEKLVWILDGKVVDERPNKSFHRPMYLNINCEVMIPWGGEPDHKDLPAEFKTEYVRVWQKK